MKEEAAKEAARHEAEEAEKAAKWEAAKAEAARMQAEALAEYEAAQEAKGLVKKMLTVDPKNPAHPSAPHPPPTLSPLPLIPQQWWVEWVGSLRQLSWITDFSHSYQIGYENLPKNTKI